MTLIEARRIIGNQPKWAIRGMRAALEIATWHNTESDWKRLEACYVVMRIPHNKRMTQGV